MTFYFVSGAILLGLLNGLAQAGRIPKAPTKLRIAEATESSFVLEWEKPTDTGDGPLTGYGVFYEFSCWDPFGCLSSTNIISNPDATTHTVKRLREIKRYKAFFVVAINDYGWSRLAKTKVKKVPLKTVPPTTAPPPTTAETKKTTEATEVIKTAERTTVETMENATAERKTMGPMENTTVVSTTAKPTGFIEIPLEEKNTTSSSSNNEPTTGIVTTLPAKETCNGALGIESEWIGDMNFGASTSESTETEYYQARLNNPHTSWVPKPEDDAPFWQVQLKEMSVLSGIAIQGHPKKDYWITKLRLEYSRDGVDWDVIGKFDGSKDRNTIVRIDFEPIYLRSLMVYALDVNNRAALRAEVYGCNHPVPTCGIRPSDNKRRYRRSFGGSEVRENSWPWVGALQYKEETFCSASLISDVWAVTAAHCFSEKSGRSGKENWKVVFGKHSLSKEPEHQEIRGIRELYMHPNHESFYELIGKELRYDFALLHLDEAVTIGEKIKPVCELNPTVDFSVGASCYTVGWSNSTEDGTRSDVLRQVNYTIVEGSRCTGDEDEELTEDFICAGTDEGGKGICEFGNGNGVYCEEDGYYYLTGIVSTAVDCSSEHKFEKLTNMKVMKEYIKKTKKKNSS